MSVEVENPWTALPQNPPFYLASDASHVDGASGLLFDRLPVPYIGRRDAQVILLTLNPGGGGDSLQHSDDYRDQCRKRLTFETRVPFMPLDPAFAHMHGAEYWKARLKMLIERTGLDLVCERLSCLQYFPYQSKTFRPISELLPSQHFTFSILREAIRRRRLIVILRSRNLWARAVPELSTAPTIELKNPRSPYITPKNMNAGDFERVVDALKKS